MTNEAVNIELPRIIKRFTVYDSQAIPLGTLLTFSGPLQVAPSSGADDPFAGIATEEKTASDGIVNIAAAQDGVWDLYHGAGLTGAVGELVQISGPNTVDSSLDEAGILLGQFVGKAHEDVTVGTAKTIRVMVGQI